MKLREIFTRKKNTKKHEIEPIKQKNIKDLDCCEIGLLDFLDIDWRFFASRIVLRDPLFIKFNQEPCDIKVALDENDKPFAEVTFKSDDHAEERKFRLYQDRARVVMGHIESGFTPLESAWSEFKVCVQGLKQMKRAQEIEYHTRVINDVFKSYPDQRPADVDFDQFYKNEDQFQKENNQTIFECFGTDEDELAFAEYKIVYPDEVLYLNSIKPFSPRILEFCVTRLSEAEKDEIRKDLKSFREKCLKIELSSSLISRDWERTVNVLIDVLSSKTKRSVKDDKSNQDQLYFQGLEQE